MKITNAIKKLEKAGYAISEAAGSYIAEKDGSFINFFVNPGSDNCSKFTSDSKTSCAPTYGMTLKSAMGI